MKKILIINGHPREKSFLNALVEAYIKGTNLNNAAIKIINLRTLELEPFLKYSWDLNHDSIPMTEELLKSQELIKWSEHIVFTYPTFWATPPALLKVFIEAIIVSKFAFKYHKPKKMFFGKIPVWDKLLKGRTATVVSTMDAPPFFMHAVDKDPGGKLMHAILRFTGIKLKHKYYFGSVKMSTEQKRKKWIQKAYEIGRKESKM